MLGPDQVFRMPPVSPSDDVSEFLRHLPGCYFFVGGGAADGSSGMHHSPTFLVEDESLRVGRRRPGARRAGIGRAVSAAGTMGR